MADSRLFRTVATTRSVSTVTAVTARFCAVLTRRPGIASTTSSVQRCGAAATRDSPSQPARCRSVTMTSRPAPRPRVPLPSERPARSASRRSPAQAVERRAASAAAPGARSRRRASSNAMTATRSPGRRLVDRLRAPAPARARTRPGAPMLNDRSMATMRTEVPRRPRRADTAARRPRQQQQRRDARREQQQIAQPPAPRALDRRPLQQPDGA